MEDINKKTLPSLLLYKGKINQQLYSQRSPHKHLRSSPQRSHCLASQAGSQCKSANQSTDWPVTGKSSRIGSVPTKRSSYLASHLVQPVIQLIRQPDLHLSTVTANKQDNPLINPFIQSVIQSLSVHKINLGIRQSSDHYFQHEYFPLSFYLAKKY